MSEKTELSVSNKIKCHTMLQTLTGIPYAILKISDEELRVGIANAKFLTDPQNFIRNHQNG
jgi:hypothetical protein